MNGVVNDSKSQNNSYHVDKYPKKRPKNDVKQNGKCVKVKRTETFEFGNYNR